MQVSRYIAPFSQHSLMRAMLETSTETLIRKSPRPMSGFRTRRKFSRVRRSVTNLMPYLAASALALVLGADDRDAVGRDADVPQHQGQHPLTDAAKADEHDASRKLDVNLVAVAHDCRFRQVLRRVARQRASLQGIKSAPRGSIFRPARRPGGVSRCASAAGRCARSPAAPPRAPASARAPDSSPRPA